MLREIGFGGDARFEEPLWGEADADPQAEADRLQRELAWLGASVEVSVHTRVGTESHIDLVPDRVRSTVTRDWAVVVDVACAKASWVDADSAWSGPNHDVGPGLASRLEAGLLRASRPMAQVPPAAQLRLVEGSAGALFHEALGHLAEEIPTRRSLV